MTGTHMQDRPPNISAWMSREQGIERIITFNASWFTVSMSTSAIPLVLHNFPYATGWLTRLGYCFWILTILEYVLFLSLFLTRCIMFPGLCKKLFLDFSQTSFLGAIPVTLNNIASGAVIYYSDRPAAVWSAYGIFWISIFLDVLLASVVVFIVVAYQQPHEINSVTGVWLLSFIPLIVTSSSGGLLIPYLNSPKAATVLVVSYLCWAVGEAMCFIIVTLYFWRLVSCHLPARDAIVSCFIPVGPSGMGAQSIRSLTVTLAAWIRSENFTLHYAPSTTSPSQSESALFFNLVAETITWIGLFVSLFLFAFSTFWLLQAIFAVISRVPKTYNIGFWAFVFPIAVYTDAACFLALDLRNAGFRGWAATWSVIVLLLWLFCAVTTFYKAVYEGKLIFGPGLEMESEKKAIEEEEESSHHGSSLTVTSGLDGTVEKSHRNWRKFRHSRPDGTYHLSHEAQTAEP